MNRLAAAVLILGMSASHAAAQTIQGGFAGVAGLNGLGVEFDISHPHAGAYVRAQGGLETRSIQVGIRGYVFGARSNGIYLGAAAVSMTCSRVHIGGVGSSCDGKWHSRPSGIVGVEIGSTTSRWSVFIDGTKFLNVVPGMHGWTASFGVRLRSG